MTASENWQADLHAMLVDVLGVDDDEITPQARFYDDLGGESIDLLELSFKCEQHFGVKVPFQDMISPDELAFDGQGRPTEATLARLGEKFPFLDLTRYESEPASLHVQNLLTVQTIEHYVSQRLAAAGT